MAESNSLELWSDDDTSDNADDDYGSDADPGVTEWITLRIPASCTIDNVRTEAGLAWLEAQRRLTNGRCPGLFGAGWGRVHEDPGSVWFYTSKLGCMRPSSSMRLVGCLATADFYAVGWDTIDQFQDFCSSPEARSLKMLLWSFHTGTSDPETFHTTWTAGEIGTWPFVTFTDYYFPTSISEEHRTKLDNTRDLTAPASSGRSYYFREPAPTWIQEPRLWGDQQATVRRVAYYWRSLTAELNFKANARTVLGGSANSAGDGEALTLWELLLRRSRWAGMLGWREYHLMIHEVDDDISSDIDDELPSDLDSE
jgi:hypothetical protein